MRRRLAAMLFALGLGGCSLAPHYVRPDAPVPQSLPAGGAYPVEGETSLPSFSHQDVFKDARLEQLIDLSLANNRDLRVAAANLAAARAQVRVTRSAQFPVVNVGGSATANRSGENYALDGGISGFELDLLGRLASATAAQKERMLASEAAARTVRIGLIADLASAWATFGADSDLLVIAKDTANNAQRSVDLTKLRLDGGIAPRSDLSQALQVLASAQGDVARQTAALAEDRNLLRLLAGTEVVTALLPKGLAEVAGSIVTLPAGTSSEVLLRRPDVAEAEHQLKAANADIGAARAALFPRISLTGLLGVASDALSTLFTDGAFSASATAGASYSIFGGGKSANLEATEARRDAALASYEKAIQSAFREIADALAVKGTIDARLDAAHRNAVAAADSAQLADARYRAGVDSFLANLVAQRSVYSARQSEVATMLVAVQNRIDLYRVLGGDAEIASGPRAD